MTGEPIVCSPRDALRTFWSTGLDALAIGSFLLTQPRDLATTFGGTPRGDALTPKWCADIAQAIRTNDTARLTSDPVLVGAIDQFNRNRTLKATPKIAVNFWAPNVSFALNMARHGTPYYRMRLASYDATWSTISIDDFASDPQFMKSLNDLRATRIPFSFIHIPMYPELAAGQEWMFDRFGVQNEQGARLVASIERLTGQKVHSILSALRASVPDPETFPKKAREPRLDWHPAPCSVQPIGAALAQFIKAQYPPWPATRSARIGSAIAKGERSEVK